MLDTRLEGFLPPARRQPHPQERSRRATACAARRASRAASSPARPSTKRSTRRAPIEARGLTADARSSSARASRPSPEADAATRDYLAIIEPIVGAGDRPQHLAEADAARARRRSRDARRQPAADSRARRPRTASSCASTWRTRRTPQVTLEIFETLWQQGYRNVGVVLQSYLHAQRGRRRCGSTRSARGSGS